MELKDIYDLISWDLLKEWAQAVKFNDEIINSQFPKYQNWTDKAVYADYLMDYVDEAFNVENSSYPKAVSLQGKKLPDGDFLEIYKLYFDSSSEAEYPSDSPRYLQWQKRLEQMAENLKKHPRRN